MKLRLLTILVLCALFALDALAQCQTGRIRNDATGSTRTIELCTGDGVADEITFRTDYEVLTAVATLITNNRGQLLTSVPGQTVNFEGFSSGECRAVILSYTGTLTATIGENVYESDLATGCFELSRNYIKVEHNAPEAGTISDNDGALVASLCIDENDSDYVGFKVEGEDADRYVFLITDTAGNVEKVEYGDYENFAFYGVGTSHVYGLAYSGDIEIRRGENIFTDELVDGCFDLTDNFLTIERNEVDGGRLRVDGEKHIDVDSTTTQAPVVARTSNSTSPFIYVIIDRSRIIRGFSQGPAVDMSYLPEGKYWIYAYGYTGTIQAAIGQRLWDSGVRFASGCFIMSDNAIVVTKTTPATTTAPCAANAGGISALASPVTLQNGIARVQAIQDGNAIVPSSYDSVYFLTVGPTETIIALSVAGPNFSVNSADTFSVYYLNAEVTDTGSPDFLDLSTVQFGITTMGEIAAEIMDSGICADLTIPGAEVIVNPDPAAPCTAFASSAFPVTSTVPLANGSAVIEATPDGGANLPANAELTFVLSKGFAQTIIALGDTPTFTVTEPGMYAIHALAAEISDPTSLDYLDRSDWVRNELDVFGAYDVIFAEGICADIDFFGAQFQVTAGSSCAAFSGTLTAPSDTVFLRDQQVRLTATSDRNAVVPTGFDRTYVLSYGPEKIVQAISAIPRFDVSNLGQYYIHAWVGEFTDPLSVDYVNLTAIRQGVAPISDIVLQIEGSGICSSIDAVGTAIYVEQFVPSLVQPLRPMQVGAFLRIGNVYGSQDQQGELIVSDPIGRVVARKNIQLSIEPQTFEIEVVGIKSGLYFLSLLGEQEGIITTQGVLLR